MASGSKGNCTFVEMDGRKILIDAGISARRIKQELRDMGQDIEDIEGVFITHEHSDHIKGVATLAKKYHLPIYTRPATFRSMSCYKELPMDCIRLIVDRVRLERISVRAFSIPHDAADPVGYVIQGSSRCIVATDMGVVDSSLQAMLEGAQVMVLEFNHDEFMLKHGTYPYQLKQRIAGKYGHLSNAAAARVVADLKQPPKKLLLAHLSEANNEPELALKEAEKVLTQAGLGEIEIYVTAQNQCVSVNY